MRYMLGEMKNTRPFFPARDLSLTVGCDFEDLLTKMIIFRKISIVYKIVSEVLTWPRSPSISMRDFDRFAHSLLLLSESSRCVCATACSCLEKSWFSMSIAFFCSLKVDNYHIILVSRAHILQATKNEPFAAVFYTQFLLFWCLLMPRA